MKSELQNGHFFFSSESVTEGHPDKLCDLLSDSILDACLEQDPESKVAMETLAKSNFVIAAGELTTKANINIEEIIRNRIKEIGYDDEQKGINYKTCEILQKITKQSPNIAGAVHEKKKQEDFGAGDQGQMFGYATDETPELFPFSHLMACQMAKKLMEIRKNGTLKWLRPDGKTQITVEYKEENGKAIPLRVENILISTQHDPDVKIEEIREQIRKHVVDTVIPKEMIDSKTSIIINPSLNFIIGGPEADTGLTGRKIVVDNYGGWGSVGGGCFSGKDSSKVDRSGAYMARWIAKSLVAAKLCHRVLVQISYSIAIADPLSVYVNTFGSAQGGKTDKDLVDIVMKNFNLRPGMIIKELGLKRPIFAKTAAYGHFGRNEPEFTWEIPKELKI